MPPESFPRLHSIGPSRRSDDDGNAPYAYGADAARFGLSRKGARWGWAVGSSVIDTLRSRDAGSARDCCRSSAACCQKMAFRLTTPGCLQYLVSPAGERDLCLRGSFEGCAPVWEENNE